MSLRPTSTAKDAEYYTGWPLSGGQYAIYFASDLLWVSGDDMCKEEVMRGTGDHYR